jgi:hypothetical protein
VKAPDLTRKEHNRLERPAGTNILAYYKHQSTTAVKSFIKLGPDDTEENVIKNSWVIDAQANKVCLSETFLKQV